MYEYKVIPAPAKGRKKRGIKGAEARFAHALESTMNELAADGWEFQRADILPSEERQGLTSTQTVYRSVLVFRRWAEAGAAESGEDEVHDERLDELDEDDTNEDDNPEPQDTPEQDETEAEKV